jgi:phage-related protein
MMHMQWQLVFYSDKKGNMPVKDFILQQSDGAIAEILHVFKLLRLFNIELREPYVKKINKSGIRALRIKHGSDIYRILFFTHTGRKFILLHAFLKKTDEIPENDKRLAIQRMNDFVSSY